jgi:hypothetical protein
LAQPAGVEYRAMKRTPGPRPTLGDLHRATPWLWLYCEKCQHHAPLACAVPVIRWGASASSDVLQRRARCTACGHKGATLQHPGWGGADVGFLPFPAERFALGGL